MTKIKGLIEDISGAIRVTKKREEAFKNAKDENLYVDPSNQVARELHPAPFLAKVIKIEENKITAIKNVTANEHYFQGRFPTEPVMPGVLIIESCH